MLRKVTVLLILCATLCAYTSVNAQTTDVPPPLRAALDAFNRYLAQPITLDQLDTFQLIQGTYADTALGCPLVTGSPLAAPVTAFRVQLVYQTVLYEFAVSADGSLVVPCSTLLAPNTIITVVTTAVPTIGLTGCPVDFSGYLPPRLTVGGFARIGIEGQPNRMREAPSLDAEQIGLIAPGTTVEVLDGPVCEPNTGIVWWQVRDGTLVGYTAESMDADYFLDPIEAGTLPALPAAREVITADNASQLTSLSAVPFDAGANLDFGGAAQLLVAGATGVTLYNLDTVTVGMLPLTPNTAALHVNYSPDGQYIAYSTESNEVFVYDTFADRTMQIEIEDGSIVNDLDLSTNQLLAVALGDPLGSQDSINGWSIYNLEDNNSLSLFYPTDSWVGDVEFGPLGLRLAWLSDTVNMVMLMEEIGLVSGQIGQPTRTGLAWQPVDDPTDPGSPFRLAYADGNVVQLFDLVTADLMSYTNEEDYLPGTLAFNQDGSILAVLDRPLTDEPVPRTLKLFNVMTGDVVYSEVLDTARDMTFSSDGTLLIALTDTTLRFYGIAAVQPAVG